MLLTEPAFLFLFLPVLCALYFPFATLAAPDWWASGPANPNKANAVLLVAGFAFLALGTRTAVWLPLGLAALNCWLVAVLARTRTARSSGGPLAALSEWAGGNRSSAVRLGVGLNVLALVLVRLGNLEAAGSGIYSLVIGRHSALSARLFVPIAVSIIAMHGISRLVDVERGRAQAREPLVGTAAYLVFFPYLLAGPLLRYREVSDELTRRVPALGGFAFGVRRFVIGLGMKLLIADTLATTADTIFALPVAQLTTTRAWLGIVCYTLQIYFALSGYSEMAIGLGRMLGFRPPENFNWPYLAQSVEGFWREWNTSLSSWFRTYVYEPIERRVRTRAGRYAAFAAVCVAFGFWHGVRWTFLAWAAYHGVILMLERVRLAAVIGRLPVALRRTYVIVLVAVGWVIFRSDSLSGAVSYLAAMAGWGGALPASPGVQRDISPELALALTAGVVGVAPLGSLLGRWRVAIDAATISAVGLLFTTALFTWRLLLNLRSFVFDVDPRK